MTVTGSHVEDSDSAVPQLGAQIKLVVWDLDETFWTGTLSEGAVEIPSAHADIVRELNMRGIVNAICSKNDFETVRERLAAEGDLWDQFVFPRIGWNPKGQTIAQLIKDIQLRPPNVLFIDDNVGNLKEAEHYAAGLQTASPAIIPRLLTLPQLAGKEDRELSRLAQYRQLQAKLTDLANATVSNEEFLRSCDIRVEINDDCRAERERILELTNRTNQLNFTKRRFTNEEIEALFSDADRQSGYVRVVDRYGDYGLCGFFSVKDGVLTDFVFSCRILHMGVENWVYQRLGRPQLTVVGEVVAELQSEVPVTWISESAASDSPGTELGSAGVRAKVLLKGGCDLVQVDDFLAGSLKTELSYTNDRGAYVEFHHIEVMRRSTPEAVAEFGEIIDRLPFISRSDYTTRALDPAADITHVALSLLNEYGQGLYRLRGTTFVVPYGQYYIDITDRAHWSKLHEAALDEEFLEWFSEHFEFCGAVTIDRFKDNIRWLVGAVPPDRTLVFINGAEVDLGPGADAASAELHLHQRRFNQALDELALELPIRICDVRAIVRTTEDVTFNTRHYTRRAYAGIAEALKVQTDFGLRVVERRRLGSFAHRARRVIEGPALGARIRRTGQALRARVRPGAAPTPD